MTSSLPLSVLLAPFVIALMAVAFMVLFTGVRKGRENRGPRPAAQELGYTVDANDSVSLTPARYVGGHPDRGAPLPTPFVLLTSKDLAVFARKGAALVFSIPWAKVETMTRLDAQQMGMAVSGVRGLSPGVLDDIAPEAGFVRVRFEDERGWWQNVVFELAAAYADDQYTAFERAWQGRDAAAAADPAGAGEPNEKV